MSTTPSDLPPASGSKKRMDGFDDVRAKSGDVAIASPADVCQLRHGLRAATEACAQAERANTANNAMLAALSHELRVPLASIALYAQLLRDGAVVQRRDLKRIGDALGRAVAQQTQLLDELLDGSLDAASCDRTPTLSTRSLGRPGKTKQYNELKDVRVLYIDDDFVTREAVFEVLELTGAEVALAATTAAGMVALKTFRPHVIVCDLAMPGEDGFAFMRKLRASEAGQAAAIPVLAFSGLASADDKRDALAAGFQMYLSKPIDVDRLRDSVAELVGLIGRNQLAPASV